MKKYAREIILIVLGAALMFYGYQKQGEDGGLGVSEKTVPMILGSVLVAIGGILAVIKANK